MSSVLHKHIFFIHFRTFCGVLSGSELFELFVEANCLNSLGKYGRFRGRHYLENQEQTYTVPNTGSTINTQNTFKQSNLFSLKLQVKIFRKCHHHKDQPAQGSKRMRDEKQIRKQQTPHMKPQTHIKKNLQQRNRLGTVSKKTTVYVISCHFLWKSLHYL